MNEGWLEDRLGLLSNMYITVMQGEVDRFQDTVRMLKDYYKGMEGKIPEEFSPEYARIPLIDVIKFSHHWNAIIFRVDFRFCISSAVLSFDPYSVIIRFLCVIRWRRVRMRQEVVTVVPQGLGLFPTSLLRPRPAEMYRPLNHALHRGKGRERQPRLNRLSLKIHSQNKYLTSQGSDFTVLQSERNFSLFEWFQMCRVMFKEKFLCFL